MPIPLLVNGVPYNYPILGDNLWGTATTDWAVAVTAELDNLIVPGDIGPTTLISIANNQSSLINVNGLAFDSSTVRSATIEYYVYRTYNSGSQEVAESGTMYVLFMDIANAWSMSVVGNNVEGSGVSFDITNVGQIQYTSSNLTPSTNYSGTMKFRARALNKT